MIIDVELNNEMKNVLEAADMLGHYAASKDMFAGIMIDNIINENVDALRETVAEMREDLQEQAGWVEFHKETDAKRFYELIH